MQLVMDISMRGRLAMLFAYSLAFQADQAASKTGEACQRQARKKPSKTAIDV